MMRIHIKIFFIAAAIAAAASSCKEKEAAPTALQAPSPEIAVLGIDSVTLLWETVENAESYQIQLNGSEVFAQAKGVCAVIGNLSSGTEYSVRMKSVAPSVDKRWLDSDFGPVLTFVTKGKTVLEAPDVKVSELSPASFSLAWAPVKKADGYVYALNGGAEQRTTSTALSFDGLIFDTEYIFKVKAVPGEESMDVAVESAWTEIKVRTLDRYHLAAPVLQLSDVGTNGFTVRWNAVENAALYQYSVNNSTALSLTETFINLTQLTAATEYTVAVRAVPSNNDEGVFVPGEWAQIKAVTNDLIVLDAPVLKTENVLAGQFTVKWDEVEHAGLYMVSLDGGEFKSVETNTVTFTNLSAVTTYKVRVKAVPVQSQTSTYKESPLSEISVTTKQGESPDDKGGDLSDFEEGSIF